MQEQAQSLHRQEVGGPPPPPHRTIPRIPVGGGAISAHERDHRYSVGTASAATNEPDSLGENTAGGGIDAIADRTAAASPRHHDARLLRDIDNLYTRPIHAPNAMEERNNYSNYSDSQLPQPPMAAADLGGRFSTRQSSSGSGSTTPTRRGIPMDPFSTPGSSNLHLASPSPYSGQYYADGPYQRRSQNELGIVNPNDIDDDGDDGLTYHSSQRKPVFGLGRGGSREQSRNASSIVMPGAGITAATSAPVGGGGEEYAPVPGGGEHIPLEKTVFQKRALTQKASRSRRKKKLIVIMVIMFVIIAAIVGGTIGGVLGSSSYQRGSGTTSSDGLSDEDDRQQNGELDLNSREIQGLMNNPDLHRVFPGMDYTPFNAQYPECLTNPPSQNNVTRDMAVLAQLTKAVRLYGTDCNQTQMVLAAIDRLQLTDMKVHMGVWVDKNQTTSDRQLEQMYSIFDRHGGSPFASVIVGNEVLYREDLTAAELGALLDTVRSNITSRNIDVPLATSDLGDDWTVDLAEEVDIVMSNIHPFFGGVQVDRAAAWSIDFWQTHDVAISPNKQHLISEIGWPGAGGNNCGAGTCTSDTQGSVAGIEELNTFMESWVCQALANGTDYFW